MRAVVFAGEGLVRLDDVPEPRPSEGDDAIVRVSLSSICGSDLHLLHGKTPGMRPGSVIGHEFVGEVADTGQNTSVRVGDRVLGSFLIACGVCSRCRESRFNFCPHRRALGQGELTGDLDGAQAEYVRVPVADVNLKLLDDSLSDERALFGGDILAAGLYGAHLTEAGKGDTAAIIGAGPVGLFAALALRRRGARPIVIDKNEKRAQWAAANLGLEVIGGAEDPHDALAALTGGAKADVAVDAVGAAPALKTAILCLHEGGRVVVLGVYGAERMELSLGRAWVSGLDLRFAGMANVQAHWTDALEAVGRREIDPTTLITHRLSLEEAPEGYALFESQEALKVVLRP
ncbi:MAG: alcohol dehydrogenase catalytic domain-containing protein [Actinomycetota bacterium]